MNNNWPLPYFEIQFQVIVKVFFTSFTLYFMGERLFVRSFVCSFVDFIGPTPLFIATLKV